MKAQYLAALIAIAEHGVDREVALTTQGFAKQLGISQQSASRLLVELEQERQISRKVEKTGQRVTLTAKGKTTLEAFRNRLNAAFASKPKTLTGTVKTGLGEGAYYMKLDGYRRQFERRLGYAPFPGTLNLIVPKEIGDQVYSDPTFFTIEGFSSGGRTFGGLRTKRCSISVNGKTTEGAIIIPDRTSHGAETVEVIAKVNLRKVLGLKEGRKVRVEY